MKKLSSFLYYLKGQFFPHRIVFVKSWSVQTQLPNLLDKLKGRELCISLLLDPCYQNELSCSDLPADYNLPNSLGLAVTIGAFKKSIKLNCSEATKIEINTCEQ